jgi:small subunit ribosomal protein S2
MKKKNSLLFTFQKLVSIRAHIGHLVRYWNPKTYHFILVKHKGRHYLDAKKTARNLKYASDYVYKASKEKQSFLFVGTKKIASSLIKKEAEKCGQFYMNHKWLGGTLTNWVVLKKRLDYLQFLDLQEKNGEFSKFTKKEVAALRRKHAKLIRSLGGLRGMQKRPDVVIIIDAYCESRAVVECQKLNIKLISTVDTNCNPEGIYVPIPLNNNHPKPIKYVLETLSCAIKLGQ